MIYVTFSAVLRFSRKLKTDTDSTEALDQWLESPFQLTHFFRDISNQPQVRHCKSQADRSVGTSTKLIPQSPQIKNLIVLQGSSVFDVALSSAV